MPVLINETDKLLTPKEVAEVLGVGRPYVYALITGGTLPSIKIKEMRRIRLSVLNEWIDAHMAVAV